MTFIDIKIFVGALDTFLDGIIVGFIFRVPSAHRNDIRLLQGNAFLFHIPADHADQRRNITLAVRMYDQQKIIPAVSAQKDRGIIDFFDLFQGIGNDDQRLISFRMTVGIVDLLKSVDVDHHGEGFLFLFAVIAFLRKEPQELTPVVQTCERIDRDAGFHRMDIQNEHQNDTAVTEDRRIRQNENLYHTAGDYGQGEKAEVKMPSFFRFAFLLFGSVDGVKQDRDDIDAGNGDQEDVVGRLQFKDRVSA